MTINKQQSEKTSFIASPHDIWNDGYNVDNSDDVGQRSHVLQHKGVDNEQRVKNIVIPSKIKTVVSDPP